MVNGLWSRIQSHSCHQYGRNFTELSTPTERIGLRLIGREGTLFETVENKTILKAEVEVIV